MRRGFVQGDNTLQIEDKYGALDDLKRRIYCSVSRCHAKASVYFGAPLCSWHDVANPKEWPRVTDEINALIDSGIEPVRQKIKQASWVKVEVEKSRTVKSNQFSNVGDMIKVVGK